MNSIQLYNFLKPHTDKCVKASCECHEVIKSTLIAAPTILKKNLDVYIDDKKFPMIFRTGSSQQVLKFLLNDLEINNSKNDNFTILLAEAYFYYLGNFYYTCQQLNALSLRKPSLLVRQRVYNLYRAIDMAMEDPQKDPDKLLAAISYVEHYNSFLQQLEDSSELTIQFWSVLLSDQPSSQKLNLLGRKLFSAKLKLMKTVENISTLTSNQLEFLIRYGLFMKYVMQDTITSENIFRRICNINESLENYISADSKFSVFQPGISVLLITASIDSLGNATITQINSNIEKILGYQRQDLIGFSANKIMPLNISSIHGKSVQNFFKTMKPKSMCMPIFQLVKRKDDLLASCQIKHKFIQRLSDGIQVALLLVQDRTASFYTEFKPLHARRKTAVILFNTENNKIIGFSKEFSEMMKLKEQISKDLITDPSIFDFIPQLKSSDLYFALKSKEGGVINIHAPYIQDALEEKSDLAIDNLKCGKSEISMVDSLYWVRITDEKYGENTNSTLVLISEIPPEFADEYIQHEKIHGLFYTDYKKEDSALVNKEKNVYVLEMHQIEDKYEEFSLVESVAAGSMASNSSNSVKGPKKMNRIEFDLQLNSIKNKKMSDYIIRLYVVIAVLLAVISIIIGIFK